jgi:hypothetical protein
MRRWLFLAVLALLMGLIDRATTYRGSFTWERRIRPEGNLSGRLWRLCVVVLTALVPAASVTACAARAPEPVGGRTGAPHIGWVIMSGDADNPDRDFVCQSNPRSECVIPADRPDERVLGHVHVYYHPAATETKYAGSIRIGFFDEPHEIIPNLTVKPGAKPGNQSVSNFVSSTSGTYTTSFAVVATSTQTGQTQNIREDLTVTVR